MNFMNYMKQKKGRKELTILLFSQFFDEQGTYILNKIHKFFENEFFLKFWQYVQ